MPDDPKKPDFSNVQGGSPAAGSGAGRPDFSNVVSGSSSTAPAGGPAKAAPEERFYVVESGDSLSKIAKKFYGDMNAWKRIFEANRDRIKNPDLIQPGWKLRIPE